MTKKVCNTGAAIVVHDLSDALAALQAAKACACAVTLISGPDAAGYAGALWWQSLIEEALGQVPGLEVTAILDCGDAPGQVMAALRQGVGPLVFTGDEDSRARLSAMAEARGTKIRAKRPAALDLLDIVDKEGTCRRWLEGGH